MLQERKFQCKLMEHIKLKKEQKTHFMDFIKEQKMLPMILNKILDVCTLKVSFRKDILTFDTMVKQILYYKLSLI